MSDEDARRYLDSVHDFHALAEPLGELGLNRQHLTTAIDFHRLPTQTVTNNAVISLEQFRVQEKLPATFVLKWLKILTTSCDGFSDKQLKTRIQSVGQK